MGNIISAKDFINAAHLKDIKKNKECERQLVEIIHEYINGKPISYILKDKEISFTKFNAMLNSFPKFLDIYEDAKIYHGEKIVSDLEASALMKAKGGNTSMLQFLLERLKPDKYGKKIDITQNINDSSTRPPGFDDFIDAEIDKLKPPEDKK